jgi:hypothetical protein
MAQLTPHAGRPKNNPKGKKRRKSDAPLFFFLLFPTMDFLPPSARDNPINPPFFPPPPVLLLFCSAVSCLYILYSSTALIELILTAGDIQCVRAGPPQQPNPNNSAIDAAAAAAAAAGNKPTTTYIHSRL